MRAVSKRALKRTSGGDLLFGFVAAIASVLLAVGVERVASGQTLPHEVMAVRGLGIPIVALVSIPVFVGIYTRVVRGDIRTDTGTTTVAGFPDGRLRETAGLTSETLSHRGRSLLAALAVAILTGLLVGILAILVLHAFVLTVLTGAGYVFYWLGNGQLLAASTTIRISGVLVGLGLVSGVLSVRFFDCVVCWTNAGPVAAVRESLRFARVRPHILIGYVILTNLIFALPVVASVAAVSLFGSTMGYVALFVLAGTGFALYANLHAQVGRHYLLPVCCEMAEDDESASLAESPSTNDESPLPGYAVVDRPLVTNVIPLALALLLVIALLAGAASIRALDVRPVETPEEPGPIEEVDEPADLIGPEVLPVESASFRQVQTASEYNDTLDRWVTSVVQTYEADHDNRRYFSSLAGYNETGVNTFQTRAYFSPRQHAMNWLNPDDPSPPSEGAAERAWHQRIAGNWTVYSVSGVELIDEPGGDGVDRAFFDQEWTILETTEDTVTLGVNGTEAVPYAHTTYQPVINASVEITLDRKTGFATEIFQEITREVDDADADQERLRHHYTFENWSHHDVDRPEDIETVRPYEWLWGVATY